MFISYVVFLATASLSLLDVTLPRLSALQFYIFLKNKLFPKNKFALPSLLKTEFYLSAMASLPKAAEGRKALSLLKIIRKIIYLDILHVRQEIFKYTFKVVQCIFFF